MRFVLYMLVAFAVRRRGLTRRDLRQGTGNSDAARPSRLRSGALNTSLRMRLQSRLATLLTPLPPKRGCLSIAYQ